MGKSVIKRGGAAVLSYVVICVIAAVLAVIGKSMKGDSSAEVGFGDVVQFVLFPAVFYAAGYFVTNKFDFPKMNGKVVMIAAAVFSGVMVLLWFAARGAYVALDLPVVQGSYALDHWLRKINIVEDYEYKYLSESNVYPNVILPILFFVLNFVYWLCYLWGNYVCVSKRTPVSKKKK